MKSRKIAIYHPYLNLKGGAERKLLLICQALLEEGADVELCVFRYDREKTFSDLIPDRLKIVEMPNRKLISWIARLFFHTLSAKWDLVIASNFPAHLPLLFFKAFKPKQKVAWICNEVSNMLFPLQSAKGRLIARLERLLCKRLDCVIANSLFTKGEILSSYEVIPKVIYSGVQLSCFYDLSQISLKIVDLKNVPYILILSRIEEHKNLELIPKICAAFPDLRVIVAGKGEAAPMVIELEEVHNHLYYVGEVNFDEKQFLYEHCKLFAFLPKHEPLGVTVMEALLFNKPVIAFASGGPLETILHRKNGFLCSTENEYLDAIRAIVESGFEVLSEYGYEYIQNRFSHTKMQQNFVEVFASLMKLD